MNNQNWMKFTRGYTNKNIENGGKRKKRDSEFRYAGGVVGPISIERKNTNKVLSIICNGVVLYKSKEKRKMDLYGTDYKEVILKKWNMRKLSRKLPPKGIKEKPNKI